MGDGSHVFGYGSLAAAGSHPARLLEHERWWGVAMDNGVDLPRYKHYVLPGGERPEVHVAFLDMRPAPGAAVHGMCMPAGDDAIAALDRRERNYERVEVTELLDDPPGRTWAYVGSPGGRARLARGVALGTAVVSRAYLELARAADPALGTDGLPVWDLRRVDHPR